MLVTVGDIIELAKIGRTHIKQESDKGIIHWLGALPTTEDIDKAREAIDKLLPDVDREHGSVLVRD